jgi:CDP-glucose 4,6-dehydratase
MEGVVVLERFWYGKRVFITGHTGFKGSWLSMWLAGMGAEVTGYALKPPTDPNIFTLAEVEQNMCSHCGDVKDFTSLLETLRQHEPEVVFHLAAQSLVRHSYADPVETFATNVLGTVNILEAARQVGSVRVVVNVTSDKCYENVDLDRGYRETDRLEGSDPYSASKACSEMVTTSYRRSFFDGAKSPERKIYLASARAGNVIGGGDWAADRLVPDLMRSFAERRVAPIRNPTAVRPWQHVLEPLHGYLLLAEKLWHHGYKFGGGWNFGPPGENDVTVGELAEFIAGLWGDDARWFRDHASHPREAKSLRLDSARARTLLGWKCLLPLEAAVTWVVDWYKGFTNGLDMRGITLRQIKTYQDLARELE